MGLKSYISNFIKKAVLKIITEILAIFIVVYCFKDTRKILLLKVFVFETLMVAQQFIEQQSG